MIRAFVRWIRRRFRRAKREPVTTVTLDGDGFVSEVEWQEWHGGEWPGDDNKGKH